MKKIYLLSSALSLIWTVSADNASAVCVQTPTCSAMGYESSKSCTGGLKCPWGNYWNCTNSNKITELTNKITNLETQITELKKEVTTSNCLVGDILYSDMTCNSNPVSGKTPIGVVFDRDKKLAIGLEETEKTWATKYLDIPALTNITSSTAVMQDFEGKKNTSIILDYCQKTGEKCPAVEYVNNYKTAGTKAGDWYLPSVGELYAVYTYLEILNLTLTKISATKIQNSNFSYYWSSNEPDETAAWTMRFNYGSPKYYNKYTSNSPVRPVLAF